MGNDLVQGKEKKSDMTVDNQEEVANVVARATYFFPHLLNLTFALIQNGLDFASLQTYC